MRIFFLAAALALSACASSATATLAPADSATSLIVGARLTMSQVASGGMGGADAFVAMTLTHADGRSMVFEEANHAPMDLAAQAADGPLAQAMGLFGGETPRLYRPRDTANAFICAPTGPIALGVHRAADGSVFIVGLKQNFAFETHEDGSTEALPFSPDQVCARLRLQRQ